MNSHPSTVSSPLSLLAETGTTSTAGGTQTSETAGSPTAQLSEVAPDSLFAPRPPIAIMGVPFDNVTSAEAIALIEQMIASRRPHYLVTPNVDFLVQASRDLELRKILFEAHLVVCDGTPLVWASRLLGNPLPERVAGADLVPRLIRVAAQKGYRLFFLGATPTSVERAVLHLRKTYPDLCIAGYYSPPFTELLDMDHEQIKQQILAAHPDLLFVAFGCPKQEKWIAMHYRSLGVPLTAGVGGTIDILGGGLKRAPAWMQKTGTEWLFRLMQEPRRLFRRYANDFGSFGWSILPQWWQLKARRAFNTRARPRPRRQNARRKADHAPARTDNPCGATSVFDGACQWVCLPERLDLAAARECQARTTTIRQSREHWLLDMSGVKFIDSTGVGLLIQWKKLAQNRGREVVLVSPSSVVQRALSLLHLQDFFLCADGPLLARQLVDARMREQAVRVISTNEGTISMEWHGEITSATIHRVWEQTQVHLKCPGRKLCLIELTHVRFLDSSGLGLMIRLRKAASQDQIELRFSGLQPNVRNVLRLAHLEEFLLSESQH